MRRHAPVAALFFVAAYALGTAASAAAQERVVHPFIRPVVVDTQKPVVLERSKPQPKPKGLRDKQFWIASAFYWGGVAGDVGSTVYGTNRGFREGNPLFATDDGKARIGLNLAISSGIYATALLLQKKGHTRAAKIFLYFAGSVRYAATIHNIGVIRDDERRMR